MADELNAVQKAQERVMEAALKLPMNPSHAAVTAVVNMYLCSARVSALMAFAVLPNKDQDKLEEHLDTLLVEKLNDMGKQLEEQVSEKRLLVPSNINGAGIQ